VNDLRAAPAEAMVVGWPRNVTPPPAVTVLRVSTTIIAVVPSVIDKAAAVAALIVAVAAAADIVNVPQTSVVTVAVVIVKALTVAPTVTIWSKLDEDVLPTLT
jgi:hypothetical protein